MSIPLFIATFLVARLITWYLADKKKLRLYLDHKHIHHIVFSGIFMAMTMGAYLYGNWNTFTLATGITAALIESELHPLVTGQWASMKRMLRLQ